METLDNTEWDILIDGTGLHQSLLALALSRSDKRILHIDSREYYGGAEAALSLQEAEEWVKNVGNDGTHSTFSDASISQTSTETSEPSQKLSSSRAYSLALAPQLIYTESKLLPYLVSSKVYRQLEFLAMGSWWVFSPNQQPASEASESDGNAIAAGGKLMRIPTTREDVVFSDKSIDLRAKRAVIKILRFIMDYENQHELWEPYSSKPFSDFLTDHFKLPRTLHNLFLALTLSLEPPSKTYTSLALPRIARHLRSTGKLGPGFSSVIPKWGGLSEIAQVACRAGAVGGAVYVLGRGIKHVGKNTGREAKPEDTKPNELSPDSAESKNNTSQVVHLDGDETVMTEWIAGSTPSSASTPSHSATTTTTISRSILVVSSPLASLFPVAVDSSPPPSGAVVVFPSGSFLVSDGDALEVAPVYIIVHSSDTGECPQGQSVVYATTSGSQVLISAAIAELLQTVGEPSRPQVLWNIRYQQSSESPVPSTLDEDQIISLSKSSIDLAFDENILEAVKAAWQKITGGEPRDFLVFEDRNPVGDEDDEE